MIVSIGSSKNLQKNFSRWATHNVIYLIVFTLKFFKFILFVYLLQNVHYLVDDRKFVKTGSRLSDFHMEFCDNKKQLFQAYFRDFSIESLEQPWKAFTDGWHLEIASKKLGIETSFMDDRYSFVLLRFSKFVDVAKLMTKIPPNQVSRRFI